MSCYSYFRMFLSVLFLKPNGFYFVNYVYFFINTIIYLTVDDMYKMYFFNLNYPG